MTLDYLEESKKMESSGPCNFCDVKITRTINGIKLYIKSDFLESWVRSISSFPNITDKSTKWLKMPVEVEGWSKHEYYPLNSPVAKDYFMTHWGKELYFQNAGPNLSFFTAKGIKDGVIFELTGVFSQTTLDKWLSEAKLKLIEIYREYIKKFEIEANISFEEAE